MNPIHVQLCVDKHHGHLGWIHGWRQPWVSWHAWLTYLLSSPIFVTWNAAYWCITAHTDIAIIHLSNFHHITALNLAAEIWTSLKAKKTTKMISLDTITTILSTTTCKAMALFYVFTGSASTSFMFKVSDPAGCWCTVQFATIVDTPFQTSTRLNELAISFVCKLHWNKSNEANGVWPRMRLFS